MSDHSDSHPTIVIMLVILAAVFAKGSGPSFLDKLGYASSTLFHDTVRPFLIAAILAITVSLLLFIILKLLTGLYEFWSTHEIIAAKELKSLREDLDKAKSEVASLHDTVRWYHAQKNQLEANLNALTLETEKAKKPAESVVADAVKDILGGLT